MHEKCELIEKEGLKETYQDKKTKTLERLRQKTKNKSIYIYIYIGSNEERKCGKVLKK